MSARTRGLILRRTSVALVIAVAVGSALYAAGDTSPTNTNASEHTSKVTVCNASPTAREFRGASGMVPVAEEGLAKIIIDPPVPEILASGMALIQFRTENLRLFPVFGPTAANVSPRIGHLHVRVDDIPWFWAHTSGDDLIVNRLTAGPHKIQIDMVNANHKVLAQGMVEFEVPQGPHTAPFPKEHDLVSDLSSSGEPPAKLITDPPLADQLAQGIAFIRYRAENAQIATVFGLAALEISPRICHLHVTVDDARWRWAHTSGGPVILTNLPPGPHKILIELVNANHKPIANSIVKFEVPQ